MINKKNIIILSSDAFSLINFRSTLIQKLASDGCIVHCMAPGLVGQFEEKVQQLGAKTLNISMSRNSLNPFLFIYELIKLYLIIKKINCDILISYFLKPNIIGGFLNRLRVAKRFIALVEGGGYIFQESSDKGIRFILKKTVIIISKISFKYANAVIFLNKRDQLEYLNCDIISKEQCLNLGPIGVELNKYKIIRKFNSKDLTFIMCARLIKEKGIHQYINAAKIINNNFCNVKFLLLGGLDMNPSGYTKDEINDLLNGSPVEWLGHLDVIPFLQKSDVFVLPTYYREGVPRSIQEAMAASMPIITTDIDGCRDIVVHGKTGFLIRPNSVKDLVRSMRKFIDHPHIISWMGNAGRNYAENYLNIHEIDKKMLQTIYYK